MNDEKAGSLRKKYPRESNLETLRHWVKLLLDDRDERRAEVERLRRLVPVEPVKSLGIVDSQKGRE